MSTVIPDTLPIFPNCPSFGLEVAPAYLVKIIPREGGFERRDRKWSRPLISVVAHPTGNQRQSEIESVLNFWHAMGGMASAFRYRDWVDYKSCAANDTPSPVDMALEPNTASGGGFRLVKTYDVGPIEQVREIYRPMGASIRIANTLGAEQTDFEIDEATGIMTPGGGFVGEPGSWGGIFYIKARFGSQTNFQISDYKVASCDMTLQEIREDGSPS